jgi:hypothetical protein
MKELALGLGIIVAVGFAYLWFNGILLKSTGLTEQELHNQLISQGQRIFIDDARNDIVVFRGIGTYNVSVGSLTILIEDTPVSSFSCSDAYVPLNSTIICRLSQSCSGKRLKAIAPGNHDSVACA